MKLNPTICAFGVSSGIAALNRFISRSTDKCLPFFKILRKTFVWNDECEEEGFQRLKEYLTKPSPTRSKRKVSSDREVGVCLNHA
jgi:hypothetical protein